MEYYLMTPSFPLKNFDKMTEKEAKKHFEWYISEIPKRLGLLKRAIEETESELSFTLDFTKNSLVGLWNWYLKNVEIVEKANEEYINELSSANEITKSFIRKEKISSGWMAVALDISIYFAECLIKAHQGLKWGIVTKPKSLVYVNKPVVIGFSNNMKLDAANILFVQTRKVLKGIHDEQALLKLFENWENQL